MGELLTGRKPHGFSLLELIVVMVIVISALTIALPAFSRILESTRVRTTSVRLVQDIVLARSEAIKRSRQVVMCPVHQVGDAGPGCGGVFANGWIVFEDSDRDGERDDDEPIMRIAPPISRTLTLTNRKASAAASQAIRFHPDGTAPGNRTLMICSRSEPRATSWSVVMNILGRPRVARDWGDCPGRPG